MDSLQIIIIFKVSLSLEIVGRANGCGSERTFVLLNLIAAFSLGRLSFDFFARLDTVTFTLAITAIG